MDFSLRADGQNNPKGLAKLKDQLENFQAKFEGAMDDDFNTAQGLGVVFDWVREVNKFLDQNPSESLWQEKQKEILGCFKLSSLCLGIFGQDPTAYWETQKQGALEDSDWSPEKIEEKIKDRKEAREAKDFKRADQIRDELSQGGIILKDNPDGTTTWTVKWKKKK